MDALDGMQAFVTVADAGTFAAAARRHGVPKSTLSRRLTRLEDRLGVQLLVRTTRNIGLTEVGSAYYDRCKLILAQIREAEDAVAESRAAPRGLLRVTLPPSANSALFSKFLAVFLERFPDMELDVCATTRVVNLTEEGYDVALRAGTLADSTLVARRLARTALLVMGAPEYLERVGHPWLPNELGNHVCMSGSTGRWQTADDRRVPLEVRIQINNVDMLRRLVVQGIGLAQLPTIACLDDIQSGRLVPVLEDYFRGSSGLYAVYPPARHLSPKVRAFVDTAVEFFAKLFPEEP